MKIETRTIGGYQYRMEQIGAETGEQITLRLARPVAALLAQAAKKGEHATLQDILTTGLVPALQMLSGRDLRYVRKKLAGKTQWAIPDSKGQAWLPLDAHYDQHFAGRYDDVLQWMRWGIGMNRFFADALQRLDAMLAARAEAIAAARATKAESPSSSPPASPGSSGGSSSPSTGARA